MRISDWSSDVCSSDLLGIGGGGTGAALLHDGRRHALVPAEDEDRAPRAEVLQEFSRHVALLQRAVHLHEQQDVGQTLLAERFRVLDARVHLDAVLYLEIPGDRRDVVGGKAVEHHAHRSEEHTSELQSLMRTPYA